MTRREQRLFAERKRQKLPERPTYERAPQAKRAPRSAVIARPVSSKPRVQSISEFQAFSKKTFREPVMRRSIADGITPRSLVETETRQSVIARQFNEHRRLKSGRGTRRYSHSSFMSRATAVMAVMLFLSGSFVVIRGYNTNQEVEAQVQQVSAQIDQGGGGPSDVSETPPTEDINAYQVAPDMPRFIEIESLGVKARVRRMGVTTDNAIQAPSNVFDAGWYDGSAKPGQNGAAFIDGHVSGYTQNGVFYDIKNLEAGATVTVEMGNGDRFTYKVVGKEVFNADKVDMSKVLASAEPGKAGLNLMTCTGPFDSANEAYTERVVVYTVLQ